MAVCGPSSQIWTNVKQLNTVTSSKGNIINPEVKYVEYMQAGIVFNHPWE